MPADTCVFGAATFGASDLEEGSPATQRLTIPCTLTYNTTSNYCRGVGTVWAQYRNVSSPTPEGLVPIVLSHRDFTPTDADGNEITPVTAPYAKSRPAQVLVTAPTTGLYVWRYQYKVSWSRFTTKPESTPDGTINELLRYYNNAYSNVRYSDWTAWSSRAPVMGIQPGRSI